MSAINDSAQLISIFGFPAYDNFKEPRPFSNEPGCLIGFTTSFLVRLHLDLTCRPWEIAEHHLGVVMDICLYQALCSVEGGAVARLG
jgi:hypothetical protein